MRVLVTSSLVAGLLALAALNVYVVLEPVSREPLAADRVGGASAPPAVAGIHRPPVDPDAEGRSETVMRPLFWRSRRPLQPIQAAAASASAQPEPQPLPQPAAPPNVRLTGVMIDGATRRQALLVWPQQPTGRWLEEGAEIDGWRLTRIERSAVHLEAGEQARQLELN